MAGRIAQDAKDQKLAADVAEGLKELDTINASNATIQLALDLGFEPVVPPRAARREPWEMDKEVYKGRIAIERLIGRLKAYRRIFTRHEKLDCNFLAFINFVLIADALR